MPLSDLQSDILRTLAAHRNPESYVAGSTPLHGSGPRYSDDIDIFHHHEEQVAAAAAADADADILTAPCSSATANPRRKRTISP